MSAVSTDYENALHERWKAEWDVDGLDNATCPECGHSGSWQDFHHGHADFRGPYPDSEVFECCECGHEEKGPYSI